MESCFAGKRCDVERRTPSCFAPLFLYFAAPCGYTGLRMDIPDFANLDLDRFRRRGIPEVIFGEPKSAEQILELMRRLNAAGQNAFATRVSLDKARFVMDALPDAQYHETARILTRDVAGLPACHGRVAVVAAGTADIPVAEEAAITAERMGANVTQVWDIGVAGLHRLLAQLPLLNTADVIIAVAGMEGALPSVMGGLVQCPVIALPTSVGYGANLSGVTAMLAMLTSCASGLTVVNIDNGFGAGIAAGLIIRRIHAAREEKHGG